MRKLLNTLFVTSEDKYLALENENVAVYAGKDKVAEFPLHTLEGIVSFSYRGASPALMGACAERKISFCFLKPNGHFLARVCGAENGNVLLRREQYRIADDDVRSCGIARHMILGKIFNGRWVLERALRDHSLQVDCSLLEEASRQLKQQQQAALSSNGTEELRGIEGKAAVYYYHVFNELILQQKDNFIFKNRNRRPPEDPVNALLSFGYTLLANDCGAALESTGLDSYVGFMHKDRPGRASLALDLEEELRPAVADRFALSLINNRMINNSHFDFQSDGAVLLNSDGRSLFLKKWQERKKETITHPYLKEKIAWGLVPYVQALLLARTIRGDLEAYPPFLWK